MQAKSHQRGTSQRIKIKTPNLHTERKKNNEI